MAPNGNSTVAFVFDIDGVLMKGAELLPGARETLRKLQESKIPFIFLTNNGGQTEEAQVNKLSQVFDLQFTTRQYVQSHTPYLGLVRDFCDKHILVIGGHGHQIRDLAHAYGFKNVITSSDIVATCENIHPFPEMTLAHHREHGRVDRFHDIHDIQIAAILVYTSSRDWAGDLQIITDLLLSQGGRLGTRSAKNGDSTLPSHGYQQDGQPKLFFSNTDVEWVTSYPHPRLAQGGFRGSLEGYWERRTNGKAKLEYTLVGKPTPATYKYAENTLLDYYNDLSRDDAVGERRRIKTVYMIGDNPESDIVGANSFESLHNIQWKSVLCETGVYVAGTTPRHVPTQTVRNVQEAVEWALEQEGIEFGRGTANETVSLSPNGGDTAGSGDSSD